MKKKIILLGLCFLLLLIFTSSSYGGLGIKATPIVKAVPDQELAGKVKLLDNDYTDLLIIPGGVQITLIIPLRISVHGEYPDSKAAISRGVIFKAKAIERAR